MMINTIKSIIEDSIQTKKLVSEQLTEHIQKSAELIINSLKNGNKLLICGNGGSAADSQHFAAELCGRFEMDRKTLPAIALTTNTSIITAIGNDYGFDTIFEKQVEAYGKPGDVFFGITTSGNSPNIITALEKAKSLGMKTISLLGKDGGKLKDKADVDLTVPCQNTARTQESHIMIIHIICKLVEDALFQNGQE